MSTLKAHKTKTRSKVATTNNKIAAKKSIRKTNAILKEPTKEVDKVKSLAVENYSSKNISGSWNTLKRRIKARNKILNEVIRLGWGKGKPEGKAIERMKNRWSTLNSNLSNPKFDAANDKLPSNNAFKLTILGDKDDLTILDRNNLYKSTSAVIREFITALNNYRSTRKVLDEEKIEFHRFDSLFNHPDVKKLVTAIPHAKFTTADIKAFTAQESGDFTNITIAGIQGKKKGLKDPTPNPSTFKGIGQHSTDARDEAIIWAAKQGISIKSIPDPRTIPSESIKLAVAYLGRVSSELLYPELPNIKPQGIEFKKMVFASYNGGPRNVKLAASAFLGNEKREYNWNDIKNEKRISSEMRKYVREIYQRLNG